MKNLKSTIATAIKKGKSLSKADLSKADLSGANLSRANLSRANLSGANLSGADLSGANLSGADLSKADLSGAYLSWAYLSGANLSRANLSRANLSGANLSGADLSWANLSWAYLSGANLSWADLSGANLSGTMFPSPTIVLLANWGTLSADTTKLLMRLDASAHPSPELFDDWATGGKCPYSDCRFQRVANFNENKLLWSPGTPPTVWEAMCIVLDEKCPGWRE